MLFAFFVVQLPNQELRESRKAVVTPMLGTDTILLCCRVSPRFMRSLEAHAPLKRVNGQTLTKECEDRYVLRGGLSWNDFALGSKSTI